MNQERIRITGMQDRKLEAYKPRGEATHLAYKRLVDTAVASLMGIEECGRDETDPSYAQHTEALQTVADEVRFYGFQESCFKDVVQFKIREKKEGEERRK